VAFLVALVVLCSSVGYLVGARGPGAPGPASVEVGFLQDMVIHHEQAVAIAAAELAAGDNPRLRGIAREIVYGQGREMGLMEHQLADWGQSRTFGGTTARAMAWMGMPVAASRMPGMATTDELRALRERTGTELDALFVRLMVAHHQGGVEMSEGAASRSDDDVVRTLANRIIRQQTLEIAELQTALG
jgi:uncharacterized protein (DUF305 family)